MNLQNDLMAYLGQSKSKPRPATQPAYRAPIAPKQTPAPILTKRPSAQPSLILVPYSDKSFAIFGDTKPIATQLGQLGGNFNRFLKRDGGTAPGWIFSNKRLETVRKTLSV